MVNTEEEIKAAKKHVGLKEDSDPNDFKDRHFHRHQYERYDAFLAGIKYQKLLKLN